MGVPTEDMRVAVQLTQRSNIRMILAEINQEVSRGATVLTDRIPYLSGSEGLDGSLELESKRMVRRDMAAEFHVGTTGTGLTS